MTKYKFWGLIFYIAVLSQLNSLNSYAFKISMQSSIPISNSAEKGHVSMMAGMPFLKEETDMSINIAQSILETLISPSTETSSIYLPVKDMDEIEITIDPLLGKIDICNPFEDTLELGIFTAIGIIIDMQTLSPGEHVIDISKSEGVSIVVIKHNNEIIKYKKIL